MVGWFEIPVADMARAAKFYEKVFHISIALNDLGEFKMGWFPYDPEKSGAPGSLVQHVQYIPSATEGPLLYFSCKDLSDELSRVTVSGGTIVQEKQEIGGGHGFMALFIDSEGNRIALHSQV